MKKSGLQLKEIKDYENHTWRKYDLELMFKSIEADVEEVPY